MRTFPMLRSITLVFALSTAASLFGRENVGMPNVPNNTDQNKYVQIMAAGCKQPTAQTDLDINNVRTTILNGGDMWWNLNSAKYEVPKVTDINGVRKHSIFSGALWIGGVDGGGNLRLAAMTYRQNGVDFYPGPLDTANVSITDDQCLAYDKIYKITRQEINDFKADYDDNGKLDNGIPDAILNWPGNGNMALGQDPMLAPFVSRTNSPLYNPYNGDYPNVFGDQTLWFVYNDKGNIHTETQGVPIGLELRTQAFSFVTNNEVNNMTFYNTEIINHGDPVSDCYFGQWVDPDLGNYSDDYVGCDTLLGLGYCYNGDEEDEGILGYGLNPPTVGVDFFQGPKNDSGRVLGMSRFVYYNNDFSNIGNPFRPQHYYNFLRGLWHDGSPMTDDGKNGTTGTNRTKYMFPGDPCRQTGWTEKSAGNVPADRRFMQSSGPFSLKTGARNNVTIGVVWARASTGTAACCLELLKIADIKAQTLFETGFTPNDGPNAPDVVLTELNQELVLTLENTGNTEKYSAKYGQGQYKFQGYKIFQLKDATVTTGELDNIDKAREVVTIDLKDGINFIDEWEPDALNGYIRTRKITCPDLGIRHSFSIKEDLFATGSKTLVNYKSYYFIVIAFANEVSDPNYQNKTIEHYLPGRLNIKVAKGIPHKTERNFADNDPNTGLQQNAKFGSGPKLVRIEGTGNGGNSLELSDESLTALMGARGEYPKTNKLENPMYLGGYGPVKVKVINPLKVPVADFDLVIKDTTLKNPNPQSPDDSLSTASYWELTNVTTGEKVVADTTIVAGNEQLIAKWGISVMVQQVNKPGTYDEGFNKSNGYIESSIEWEDASKQWLWGVEDIDGDAYANWIRSGDNGYNSNFGSGTGASYWYQYDFARNVGGRYRSLDKYENFEKVCQRRMAPYRLCARAPRDPNSGQVTYGPAWSYFQGGTYQNVESDTRLEDLSSIDLVLTSDKSKWTRCVVLEMCEDANLSEGNMPKFHMRLHKSWTGEVDASGNPIYDANEYGRSWFPGYAINVETGERLNIMFGEDSFLKSENGDDMIWNPTSNYADLNGPQFGGKHYIYVCGSRSVNIPGTGTTAGAIYDEGKTYYDILKGTNPSQPNTFTDQKIKRLVTSQIMWVNMAMKNAGFTLKSIKDGIVPSEVKFRIRVAKPYAQYYTSNTSNSGMPHYKFSTKDIAADYTKTHGKNALDLINIVPNPYYGYSTYENSQLDTRVKITNLPRKCTINIFTVSGTLVRRIKKEDDAAFIDWDLKNNAQVPIASGVYLIHIDCGELGEKVLKWFGVMRPVDLDTF